MLEIKEIFEDKNIDFKLDVTTIVQEIMGKDLVLSATVTLQHVECFESLSDKKQQKIRNKVYNDAENLLNHADTLDSLATPGDGRIEIVLINGKKIFLWASGGEAIELMSEDAYIIQSNGLI